MASTTVSAIASGTITRRMAVHFWPALTVISVTTPLTKRSSSGSSGVTSGPRIEQLSESASTPSRTPPCRTEGCWRSVRAGGGGAGERDRVLRTQLLEQSGGTAAQQLQGPLGQDARVDDAAYDRLGQVGGLARGLDDARHPGEERGGELLQEAPDREVERVDLHRDTGSGRVQVLPEEGAAPAELLARAVQDDGVVGELAGALRGEGEDRADAAVDVDHRVDPGGTGPGGQRVEGVLVLGEVLGHGLEQRCPLVEGQRTQRRPSDLARVRGHGGQVEPGGGDPGHLLAGGGVVQGGSPRPRPGTSGRRSSSRGVQSRI